ncbi:MAG: type II secretion system protein [Burkholderiales bacterium]|nr:type II secretion system protein [Burkholderiales bacterium]
MVKSRGFVLMASVLLVFVVAVLLALLARLWEADSLRDRERELLWVGSQFRAALVGYAAATPEEASPLPERLDELLLDHRVDPPVRHLRRLYVDPMTAKPDWDVVRTEDGRIRGIRSRSKARPLRPDGLWPEERAFAGAKHYSDWVFTMPGLLPAAVTPQTAADGDR